MSKTKARRRGEGSVYTRRDSDKYWIKYFCNGKPYLEPTGKQPDCGSPAMCDDKDGEKKAWAYLGKVMKKVASAELGYAAFVGGRERDVTVSMLLAEAVTTYEAKCVRDNKDVTDHSLYSGTKKAKEWFGHMRAMDLTPKFWNRWTIEQLPELRQQYRAASINRVLAYVRRALRLGVRLRMISYVPSDVTTVMLKREEAQNVRRGFFEFKEFQMLLEATDDEDLRDFYWFGYLTGWRSGSIKKLKWETIDRRERTILSEASDQKTGEKNHMPMDAALHELIERRWAKRTFDRDGVTAISDYVFHREGVPIGRFNKSWATACKKAGLMKPKHDREGRVVTREVDGTAETIMIPSKLFHDFRRTAARDIYMATKDVATAKAITGHKTDAMFDRYNIVVNAQKAAALTARLKMVKAAQRSR